MNTNKLSSAERSLINGFNELIRDDHSVGRPLIPLSGALWNHFIHSSSLSSPQSSSSDICQKSSFGVSGPHKRKPHNGYGHHRVYNQVLLLRRGATVKLSKKGVKMETGARASILSRDKSVSVSFSSNHLILCFAAQSWHIVLQPWSPGLQLGLLVIGLIEHLADSPWPPHTDER